jgi:hypothetical protein
MVEQRQHDVARSSPGRGRDPRVCLIEKPATEQPHGIARIMALREKHRTFDSRLSYRWSVTATRHIVMAGLVPAIHVFVP